MKKFLQLHTDYYKNYYENNKDKYKKRTECICGKSYSYTNKFKHVNTKHHKIHTELVMFGLLPTLPPLIQSSSEVIASLKEQEVLCPEPTPKD